MKTVIKAAFFDLDGTMLDRDASVKQFIVKQYDRLEKFLSPISKRTYCERFIELDNHGYVWKDKVYTQLVEDYQIKGLTSEDLLEDYLTYFKEDCLPFPKLVEMLEQLKQNHLKLAIISNGYGRFQMDNILFSGIKSYFEVILISEWEGMKKPDQQIFQRAMMKLNMTPKECIFIGDHPKNDILAAKQAGMETIWKRNDQWNDAKTNFIIDELIEIPQLITNLNKKKEFSSF